MACGFFPGKGSGCSVALPRGWEGVWLVLLKGLYGMVPWRANLAW